MRAKCVLIKLDLFLNHMQLVFFMMTIVSQLEELKAFYHDIQMRFLDQCRQNLHSEVERGAGRRNSAHFYHVARRISLARICNFQLACPWYLLFVSYFFFYVLLVQQELGFKVNAIVTGEFAILIPQKLQFGVYHRFYCLLIYDYSVILSCLILN